MTSRKGSSYLGGHSIEGNSTRIGYSKPTFGNFNLALTLKAAGFREKNGSLTKIGKAKFTAWSDRKDAIGVSQESWTMQKRLLQANFHKAFKNSSRTPEEIARYWNSEGFRTFSSREWRSSLVLTAAKLLGIAGFVRTNKSKRPVKRPKRPRIC